VRSGPGVARTICTTVQRLLNQVPINNIISLTAFRFARGSIMTPGVLSSETILVRRDTMEVLLFTVRFSIQYSVMFVRTWWSTPSTPTDGTIVGTFGYLCAPKSWSSTSPTIVLGILGKTSGDPCVITRSHLRDATSTSTSMDGALHGQRVITSTRAATATSRLSARVETTTRTSY